MTPDHAANVLIESARGWIRESRDGVLHQVAHGKAEEFYNPFTRQKQPKYVSSATKVFADKIRASALGRDEEFLAALGEVMAQCSSGALFSLFTAHDGEGSLNDHKVRLVITADGCGPLPTYLHDKLFPIDGPVASK